MKKSTLTATTEEDTLWMQEALKLAHLAQEKGEVPVGSVLVLEGRILSKSFNKKETLRSPLGHAEVLCLHQGSQKLGRWRLNEATLYVTLEPCIMCAGLLIQSRIGRLVYGAKDPKGGGIHSLYQLSEDPRLNHRFPVTGGVMKEACGKILTDFFKQRRKDNASPEKTHFKTTP